MQLRALYRLIDRLIYLLLNTLAMLLWLARFGPAAANNEAQLEGKDPASHRKDTTITLYELAVDTDQCLAEKKGVRNF